MGGDPRPDPGLSASPWVSVRLEAGAVTVDGLPVQADGTAEGRYLAALQQVADEVATPLGRRVGVTVAGAGGVVNHLAVHPDGTVDSIEELVRDAHAPAATVVPTARAERIVASPTAAPIPAPARVRRRRPRSTLVAAAAVLLAAGAVVAAPLVNGRDGELASSTSSDLGALPAAPGLGAGGDAADVPAAAVDAPEAEPVEAVAAQQVLAGPRLLKRPVLAATATSTAPGEVTLRLDAPARAVHAEILVQTSDGRRVVRRLRLGPGRPTVVVLADLEPGRATWLVRGRSRHVVPDRGQLQVMAPPPEPATAPATTGPTAPNSQGGQTSGGRSGGHGGGGQPAGSPVVPIDPDDQ